MSVKKKIIVVLGSTASGKSGLALELAKKFNGYLISADSRQIYKEMNIGTNKDKGEWQVVDGEEKYMVDGVPLYLVDQLEPDQEFSVVDWREKVLQIIEKHTEQIPIIVGGTGLYISALVDNYSFTQARPDERLRQKLEAQLKKDGLERMWKRLCKLDPYAQDIIDSKNPRRVLRALEVCLKTGKPFSNKLKKQDANFEFLQLGMSVKREKLNTKIVQRVDDMVDEGLIEEVENLHKKGFSWDLPAMTSIGYRQFGDFLQGKIHRDEAIDLVKQDTKKYAKRQMTWFKRDKRINWIETFDQAEKLVKRFLF